jgi:hypothetical protein
MSLPEKIESFIEKLPDAESARRFYAQFAEKFPPKKRNSLVTKACFPTF